MMLRHPFPDSCLPLPTSLVRQDRSKKRAITKLPLRSFKRSTLARVDAQKWTCLLVSIVLLPAKIRIYAGMQVLVTFACSEYHCLTRSAMQNRLTLMPFAYLVTAVISFP